MPDNVNSSLGNCCESKPFIALLLFYYKMVTSNSKMQV